MFGVIPHEYRDAPPPDHRQQIQQEVRQSLGIYVLTVELTLDRCSWLREGGRPRLLSLTRAVPALAQVCDSVTVSGVKFLRRRIRRIMRKQRQLYGPDFHGSLQAAAKDLVARHQLNTADLNTALIHYCPKNRPHKRFQVRREGPDSEYVEVRDTPPNHENLTVWECSWPRARFC